MRFDCVEELAWLLGPVEARNAVTVAGEGTEVACDDKDQSARTAESALGTIGGEQEGRTSLEDGRFCVFLTSWLPYLTFY